ncbi:MAG: nucleoside-diphosphate sugar epimerase/dehydratase [Acidobacteriota bacterium]
MRGPAQFLADVVVLCAAFILAYLPAINVQINVFFPEVALTQVFFVLFIEFSVLYLIGAYSIIWRYVSIGDIKIFAGAASISAAILLSFRFILGFTAFNLWQIPISVILIQTVLGFGGLLGIRVLRRILYEFNEKNTAASRLMRRKRTPTLLIGAGRTGASLAREVSGRADSELDVRGFIDDDVHKVGGRVAGLKVLGTTGDLGRIAGELSVTQAVITLDNAQGREIRRLIELCTSLGLKTRIVPALNELAEGRHSISRVRDVSIEDLLGREPVRLLDENIEHYLAGRTIMVTGAGGSIGAELVRQIARYRPGKILLVERYEFGLFEIDREIQTSEFPIARVPLIADICDRERMGAIFETYRPEIVFHAAAHKHVPLMEINTTEAVKNNIFATRLLGELAGESGVRSFVLVSTDKAVNPASVMGATKRAAEIVLQDLGTRYKTAFVAVRFGNVLGSAGSAVPIFAEQIRKGGPVTVTDPKMTRYFMTIPEASQLVIQAGALGKGGEIFVLDMGEPVRILDLAEDMIRLSGLTPYEDIEIVFTGARPGEKIFEELEMTGENLVRTEHPKVFIGKIATYSSEAVSAMLADLRRAVSAADDAAIRRMLNHHLPEATVDMPDADMLPAAPEDKSAGITSSPRLRLVE